MAYLLIDDGMGEHEKLEALSDKDFRAHFRAMCWCARRGTDGRIPPQMLETLRIKAGQVTHFIEVGVWDMNGSGWVIHDWTDFNPPTDPEERRKWNARKRQQRRRAAVSRDPKTVVQELDAEEPWE